MIGNFNDFQEKFKIKDFEIIRSGGWVLTLRPQQPTIGSMVLSLDRPCERLSGLTINEGANLAKIFWLIEEIFAKTFRPDKINYLGLMMVDNHVHFHVIPRYSKPVVLSGHFFNDHYWPGPPGLEPLKISNEKLKAIHNTFTSAVINL